MALFLLTHILLGSRVFERTQSLSFSNINHSVDKVAGCERKSLIFGKK